MRFESIFEPDHLACLGIADFLLECKSGEVLQPYFVQSQSQRECTVPRDLVDLLVKGAACRVAEQIRQPLCRVVPQHIVEMVQQLIEQIHACLLNQIRILTLDEIDALDQRLASCSYINSSLGCVLVGFVYDSEVLLLAREYTGK